MKLARKKSKVSNPCVDNKIMKYLLLLSFTVFFIWFLYDCHKSAKKNKQREKEHEEFLSKQELFEKELGIYESLQRMRKKQGIKKRKTR